MIIFYIGLQSHVCLCSSILLVFGDLGRRGFSQRDFKSSLENFDARLFIAIAFWLLLSNGFDTTE